jgi:cyclin-dependent kinase regulatory subunit CKS1
MPKEHAKNIPQTLLADYEWRNLGIQQSRGWEHYACHRPEPHILLFRRPLGTVSYNKIK